MKIFIVSLLCFLNAFQGSQSQAVYPATDEVPKVFDALRNGDVQSVENSLSSVSVDSSDRHGYTLLMRAAENGDEAMVEMLLKHGADANNRGKFGELTALLLANNKRGCDSYDWNCDPRSKVNYDRISELLIKNGADVNVVTWQGDTILHEVAIFGYAKVAEMVFKNGGSKIVNIKSVGVTPLCYLAKYGYANGHDEVAKLLIHNGADVNLRCGYEQTALHLAAERGYLMVVKLLVDNGAEVAPKDKDGKTPLDLAQKYEFAYQYEAVVAYLKQA